MARVYREQGEHLERGDDGRRRYTLDDRSELASAEVAENIAKRKADGELITIADVGERRLTAAEVAYNQATMARQRQEWRAKQDVWERETADGRLYKAARQKHDEAMSRAYGKEGSYGGTVSWQSADGKRMIRIGNSSFGDFWVTITAPGEELRFELGPDGWGKTRRRLSQPNKPQGPQTKRRAAEPEYTTPSAPEMDRLAQRLLKLEFRRYPLG